MNIEKTHQVIDNENLIYDTFECIETYIGFKWQDDMFKDLSMLYGCGRDDILIIENSVSSRLGIKNLQSLKLYFKYNKDSFFRGKLKNNFQGLYIKSQKCWTIIPTHLDQLLTNIFDRFSLVIYLSENTIYFNNNKIKNHKNHYFVYKMLPYFIKIDLNTVLTTFLDILSDLINKETKDIKYTIKIHNGSYFEKFENQYVYTKCPFLLFHISITDTNHFYFSYSSLGNNICNFCYGNNSKDFNQLIARFKDPIHQNDFPIISSSNNGLTLEHDILKKEYYGVSKYLPIISYIESHFSDLKTVSLCTDYISLIDLYHSGEIEQTNTVAYTFQNDNITDHALDIAQYFGMNGQYVIFFARHNITEENFSAIFIHEICHFITHDEKEEHGILFCITNDLLQLFINRELHNQRSSLVEYDIVDEHSSEKYILAIKNIGIPALEKHIQTELFNFDFIRSIVLNIKNNL